MRGSLWRRRTTNHTHTANHQEWLCLLLRLKNKNSLLTGSQHSLQVCDAEQKGSAHGALRNIGVEDSEGKALPLRGKG